MRIKASNVFGILSVVFLIAGGDLFQRSIRMGGRSSLMRRELTPEGYSAFERKAKSSFRFSVLLLGMSVFSYFLRVGFGLSERKR